ncbi:molybdenum cofactor guanylyltransferase MobA [Photorhabdus sp. S8-52]|nr:molybdenum cofactor guanylyltransferase MobA [Photorhabdus sp. S9-53]RAX00184.1 molybdenum cofactor guanylyltransferase MobA [Photorhabdus sp. S10-54]RAX04518.1 molybdenum cofactor guanylyltransferase MobA [Photorhabdus sp. S8-52]
MNIMQPKISGAILAGGRATRMGGNDKGLIFLNKKPLYQHIADKLFPQVDELIINANRNLDIYRQSGYQIVPDLTPDFSGPLSGILTVLKSASYDWVIFVPCDVPDLPTDLVIRLWQGKQQALAAYVNDGYRAHPTIALLHRSLTSQLENYLANGDRKLILFMHKIRAIAVQFDDNPIVFTNLNTPEDCRHWEHIQEIKK